MKFYTQKQVNQITKSFTDWCDSKGYATCDLFLPDIEPLEIEIKGEVKKHSEEITVPQWVKDHNSNPANW